MTVNNVKKVVVIGPESTGKSTLCAMLAQHFATQWCAEFAREYLLTNGTNYTYNQLEIIAKGQLALEDEHTQNLNNTWAINDNVWINTNTLQTSIQPPILFLDTDMYVMKVWSEYVFEKCSPFVLKEIVTRKYDLYLLCNIDLPWVKDELREYPDEKPRQELFSIYKDILINQPTPWVQINGSYNERLATAIQAVNKYITN